MATTGIYAENNFLWINPSSGITIDQFIERLNGFGVYEVGTMLNSPSQSGEHIVDLVDAYNAVNDPNLLETVGWSPSLFVDVQETQDVKSGVQTGAGPANW